MRQRREPTMDPVRRNIIATGAPVAATAAAPRVFAQAQGQGGASTSLYEKGNVRIRYQEGGSGFPLLVTPGGGLHWRISLWRPAGVNAIEEFQKRRGDVSMEPIEKHLHRLYRLRADFVYRVSREFARNRQAPMLVLPDDTPAHAYQASVDVASLAPNAEVTVYPWKDPPELKARTINRVRKFLKAHLPATAAR